MALQARSSYRLRLRRALLYIILLFSGLVLLALWPFDRAPPAVDLQRGNLQTVAGASFLIPTGYIIYPRFRGDGEKTLITVDAALPDLSPAMTAQDRYASVMDSVRVMLLPQASPPEVLERLRRLPYYDFSGIDWTRPGLQEMPGDDFHHRYVFVEGGTMAARIDCVRMPDPTAPQQPLPLCKAGVIPYLPGLNVEMSFPAALLPEFPGLRNRVQALLDHFRAEAARRRS